MSTTTKRKHLAEIEKLHNKGLSTRQISQLVGITPQAVWSNLQLISAESKNIEQFQADLPKHLSKIIAKLVNQLHQVDLDKVTPYQLVGMISLLIDKQRLITGQSTSNQAVLFNIVESACKPCTSFVHGNDTRSSDNTLLPPPPVVDQGENILAGG